MTDLDAIDIKILGLLQEDASRSVSEIAEQVHLSNNACWRRVRQLEDRGIIRKRVALLDASYAIPLAFLLGFVALVMARRARRNLRWLRLRQGGTAVASAGVIVGTLAVCLAVAAALSVGFYGLVLLYQHSR